MWVVFSTFYEGSGPPADAKDHWQVRETEADAKAAYDHLIERGARSAGYAKIQEGTDWW